MPRCLVTANGARGDDDPRLQPIREAGWTVNTHRWPGNRPPEEEVVELVQGYDAVMASSTEVYTRAVFERCDTLKHVARWGVGYETIDLQAATDNGVLVTTTQGGNHWAVADMAFALMLAVARNIVPLDAVGRSQSWSRINGRDVWQKTLGIVGLGRIGKGVAQRAFGFEMQVVAYEPFPDLEFCKQWNVQLVSLDDLFSRSDYVSIHAPGEGENVHLVNAHRLSQMKRTAVLINTARGVLVDEDALYEALTSGRIGGAGLDVRQDEPPLDDRFSALKNVVLTPHAAGGTVEAGAMMAQMAIESVLQAARGEQPHGLLNPEVWERRRGSATAST